MLRSSSENFPEHEHTSIQQKLVHNAVVVALQPFCEGENFGVQSFVKVVRHLRTFAIQLSQKGGSQLF